MSKIIIARRPPSVPRANRERSGRTSSRVGNTLTRINLYVTSVTSALEASIFKAIEKSTNYE